MVWGGFINHEDLLSGVKIKFKVTAENNEKYQ